MSPDDRIEQRLRQEATNDPPYRPGAFEQWVTGELTRQPVPRSRRVAAPIAVALQVAIVAVVAVALGTGLAVIRDRVATIQVGEQPDLLSNVRSAGSLRVAVRPDFPQATTGSLGGFDVDVATELAARLQLDLHLVTLTPDQMRSSTTEWDVAMPSAALAAADAAFASSEPYYAYPTSLLVPSSSAAAGVDDLVGSRICVVAGSAGEAWLIGAYTASSTTEVLDPPASPSPQVEQSDDACLDALSAGIVDALVTQRLGPADIATLSSARALGRSVLTEPRSVIATRAGTDPNALITEINRVLADMRSDGTLADLSRNRFGGQDLTSLQTPP